MYIGMSWVRYSIYQGTWYTNGSRVIFSWRARMQSPDDSCDIHEVQGVQVGTYGTVTSYFFYLYYLIYLVLHAALPAAWSTASLHGEWS